MTRGISVTYTWEQLKCEICKTIFPNKIKICDKIIDLIDIPIPDTPHIMLEDITPDNDNGVHLVPLIENESAKIGRG